MLASHAAISTQLARRYGETPAVCHAIEAHHYEVQPQTVEAVLVIAASGGLWYRAGERRRMEGEEARRQVLLSLQIAGNKLNAVQMKINRHEESRQ